MPRCARQWCVAFLLSLSKTVGSLERRGLGSRWSADALSTWLEEQRRLQRPQQPDAFLHPRTRVQNNATDCLNRTQQKNFLMRRHEVRTSLAQHQHQLPQRSLVVDNGLEVPDKRLEQSLLQQPQAQRAALSLAFREPLPQPALQLKPTPPDAHQQKLRQQAFRTVIALLRPSLPSPVAVALAHFAPDLDVLKNESSNVTISSRPKSDQNGLWGALIFIFLSALCLIILAYIMWDDTQQVRVQKTTSTVQYRGKLN